MFNKKDTGYREGFDTLIGINTTFEGNIDSEGTVRVDGKLRGDLKVNGDVIVGNDAYIKGNVFANNVHLSGTVEGNIECKSILRILATAKLYGDIRVNSFVADEGAVFQGKCCMLDVSEAEKTLEKSGVKKPGKDYKKSTVLDQVYEEKEKSKEVLAE